MGVDKIVWMDAKHSCVRAMHLEHKWQKHFRTAKNVNKNCWHSPQLGSHVSHARPHGCICAQVRPRPLALLCRDALWPAVFVLRAAKFSGFCTAKKMFVVEGPGKPTWLREMTFFRRGSRGSRMFAVDHTLLFRRCRISRRDTNHAQTLHTRHEKKRPTSLPQQRARWKLILRTNVFWHLIRN